jgi:uncharacterized protein YjbJ (UPF0337 family)
MNKDQAKGAAKNAVGNVQQQAGKLIGSDRQQAKGIGKQIEGKAQEALGDAEEALKTARTTSNTNKRV